MIDEIMSDLKLRMEKSIDALKVNLSKLRTGRAHPSLLDHVKVDYYDQPTALNQVANIAVENARTLTVTPWEKSMVAKIEKAIMTSDLGLNPATAGTVIRVPLPALTQERRRDLTRVVRDEVEQARVAARNIRRDVNNDFKELCKAKEISEDDERRAVEQVQKLTDQTIEKIDAVGKAKEADLLAI